MNNAYTWQSAIRCLLQIHFTSNCELRALLPLTYFILLFIIWWITDSRVHPTQILHLSVTRQENLSANQFSCWQLKTTSVPVPCTMALPMCAISGLCPQGGLWEACMCIRLCLFFKHEIITSALTNTELYSWLTSIGWSKNEVRIFLKKKKKHLYIQEKPRQVPCH